MEQDVPWSPLPALWGWPQAAAGGSVLPAARERSRAWRRGGPASSCGPSACWAPGEARPGSHPPVASTECGSVLPLPAAGRMGTTTELCPPPLGPSACRAVGPPPVATAGCGGNAAGRGPRECPSTTQGDAGETLRDAGLLQHPATRTSSPALVTGLSEKRVAVNEAAPEAPRDLEPQQQGPAWGPAPRSREPPRPPLTAACLQGPSSSPTSSPWPSRASRCSTSSSPSASGCAEAASACGRPSRPTWAESVGACGGPPAAARGGWLGAADGRGAGAGVQGPAAASLSL